jgi:hypothetical protein
MKFNRFVSYSSNAMFEGRKVPVYHRIHRLPVKA